MPKHLEQLLICSGICSRRYSDSLCGHLPQGASTHKPKTYLVEVKSPKSRTPLIHLRLAEQGPRCETARCATSNARMLRGCRACGKSQLQDSGVTDARDVFLYREPPLVAAREKLESIQAAQFAFLPSSVGITNEEAACQILPSWLSTHSARSFWPVMAKSAGDIIELFKSLSLYGSHYLYNFQTI